MLWNNKKSAAYGSTLLGLTHDSACSVWLVFSASPSILMSVIWFHPSLRTHGPMYMVRMQTHAHQTPHKSPIEALVKHRVIQLKAKRDKYSVEHAILSSIRMHGAGPHSL